MQLGIEKLENEVGTISPVSPPAVSFLAIVKTYAKEYIRVFLSFPF